MGKHPLLYDVFIDNQVSIQAFEQRSFSQKDMEYRRMLDTLKRAMRGELTEKQYQCIYKYYYEGKKQKEIATELQIQPPAVSKHIKKAKLRLSQVMQYGFNRLAG